MAEQASEEQIAALQEKIKNMSPEELKEFQKKQCIFCQIISGKVQSKVVYEDNYTKAILDINPSNPGHILLLPKEHYTIMPQMPQDEIGHIFKVAKQLSNTLLRGIGAGGTNILVANGVAAGQRAQHFMIHIIPRMDNDDIPFSIPQNNHSEKELEKIQNKLSKTLGFNQDEGSKVPPQIKSQEKKKIDADFKEEKNKNNSVSKEEQPLHKLLGEEDKNIKENSDDETEEETGDEDSKEDEEADLNDIANLLGGR